MRSAIAIRAIGAVIACGALACQSSDVSRQVGARCDRSSECAERCLFPGADYPGGFCTIGCTGRTDCPSGTTCADREGGVCLFECASDASCAFLGTGWGCKSVDLRGGGIKVMVCAGG
ncbi:MAG: hypothetical protein E6J90_52145 [Deltaproteobacteria bacterium]|nr:MAG: hypothetical protein E6J90_52145 [Deltaproteobacteria bacterium]TMQ18362.1 MAG: hypothetical protein E6J91_08140 [Deltaproteobacteria bacterium]